MTATTLEHLRPYEPAMRDWVADCIWLDLEDDESISALPFALIVEGITRHYEGGIAQFIRDGEGQ